MEKKINIAELLKDCPKGMGLNCTMYENVYLDKIDEEEDRLYPIICYIVGDGIKNPIHFTKFGEFSSHINAKCVIFPKGKTTWEGFVPPCKFKDGDIITDWLGTCIFKGESEFEGCVNYYCGISNGHFRVKDDKCNPSGHYGYIVNYRLSTEEEKEKLFKAIKDNGYKWNAETRNLEKLLVEPKFEVGNRIRHKTHIRQGNVVTEIKDTHYILDDELALPFINQDDYELVPYKFDISKLIPFESRVLVRDYDSEPWRVSFWGCLINNLNGYDYYDTTRGYYKQCIPYEGNEHLMGKTDNCTNFYKNWE